MNQLILLVILLVAMAAISAAMKAKKGTENSFQYINRKKLMTPAERSFYGVLTQAVGNDIEIFSKVRLADIVSPENGLSRSDWQKAFNKISAKHIDFVLCAKNNLEILCAIELNDSSHNARSRTDRDGLVETICRSAQVPFLTISAKASYNLEEVKKTISTVKTKRSTMATDGKRSLAEGDMTHQNA